MGQLKHNNNNKKQQQQQQEKRRYTNLSIYSIIAKNNKPEKLTIKLNK
jgi:hypothetical protein